MCACIHTFTVAEPLKKMRFFPILVVSREQNSYRQCLSIAIYYSSHLEFRFDCGVDDCVPILSQLDLPLREHSG